MITNLDFSKKVILLTGAMHDLGKVLTEMFTELGATVVFSSSDPADFPPVALNEEQPHSTQFLVKNGDSQSIYRAIERIKKDFGRIDVLINCASSRADARLPDDSEAAWRIFQKDVQNSVFFSLAAAKHMQKQRAGAIINVSSAWISGIGKMPYTTVPNLPWIVARGSLISLTRGLAHHYTEHDIRVNAVMLLPIFRNELRPDAGWIHSIPTQEETAGVILFLASELSALITGEVIALGGAPKPDFHF